MGAGWETYGQPRGYTQAQWDALPQATKDVIKRSAGATGGGSLGLGGLSPSYDMGGGSFLDTDLAMSTATDPYADTTGGTTDGGSGGYATALEPPKLLAESPEWLAYLNALGLEENQYRADIDKTRALYQSDAERQKGDLTPVYNQSRRGIAGSLESRGMSRSGELLRRLAENRGQEGRQRAGIDATLAGQTSGLESQLANKLMELNRSKAQQELQLKSQGYI